MGIAFGSTHPTLAAMAFREEHRGHGRSHESACGSGLVPDAVPGCLPHRTEVALQVKLSRRRNRLPAVAFARSEEHTSELQSLMRISYAVFCLKKKNN